MSAARNNPELLEQQRPPSSEPEPKERGPKFVPILDQPEQITLGEMFWHENGSVGYRVTHCGVEKVWFVKGAAAKDLDGYPVGQQLLVCTRKANENARPYPEIRQALFEEGGMVTAVDPKEEKRGRMKDLYLECLQDADEVLRRFNDYNANGPLKYDWKFEDVRQAAASFFIERNKKNW